MDVTVSLSHEPAYFADCCLHELGDFLLGDFAEVLRNGRMVDLDDWLGRVHFPSVHEMVLFAEQLAVVQEGHLVTSLRIDLVAVYPQPTEANVPFRFELERHPLQEGLPDSSIAVCCFALPQRLDEGVERECVRLLRLLAAAYLVPAATTVHMNY